VVAAGLILPSVFLNGISAALYPHYPTEFNNPVFDLAAAAAGRRLHPLQPGRLWFSGWRRWYRSAWRC